MMAQNGGCTSFCFTKKTSLYRDGQTCKACHGDCNECTGPKNTQCVACAKKDAILFRGTGEGETKCIAKCPAAMYHDTKANTCRPCLLGCQVCTATEFCLDTRGPFTVALVANEGAHIKQDKAFTYNPRGRLDAIAPAAGQLGTKVVIDGLALRGSGTGVEKVFLAEVEATITKESDTQVAVVAQDSKDGKGYKGAVLLVSKSGATVTRAGFWTYTERGVVKASTRR